MEENKLLEINDLVVNFPNEEGSFDAVRRISFSLEKGETLGIVGESGSGKSVTALSILGLLPSSARIAEGSIHFQNKKGEYLNLAGLPSSEFQRVRGKEIAMIFQEPMTSLNPVQRCGNQVSEAVRQHLKLSQAEAKAQVLSLFEKVNLPEPQRIYRSYAHQLSGGQRQRVMIAMALCCNPSLLLADEPTSSLDVTVQRAILDLLKELRQDWGGSIIFITHDLGVVAEIADRVLVMKGGEIVEQGRVEDIFKKPKHPYTQELLQNSQLVASEKQDDKTKSTLLPIMKAEQVSTWFTAKRSFFGKPLEFIKAVDEVTIDVYPGETLGLVGESGSGKTTLGRSLLFLETPISGSVTYEQGQLAELKNGEWKALRKDLQIIFQDPYSSLNPRIPVGEAILEPMKVHGILADNSERREKVYHLLETVGLSAEHYWRYPSEFSGGQRQRICIARALALEPKLIICDECVSALDVTVQRQVLDLLKKLQTEKGLTYIFISHDLSVVRHISDRVAVMKDGKIVELGRTEEIWRNPKHEYTKTLFKALPKLKHQLQ